MIRPRLIALMLAPLISLAGLVVLIAGALQLQVAPALGAVLMVVGFILALAGAFLTQSIAISITHPTQRLPAHRSSWSLLSWNANRLSDPPAVEIAVSVAALLLASLLALGNLFFAFALRDPSGLVLLLVPALFFALSTVSVRQFLRRRALRRRLSDRGIAATARVKHTWVVAFSPSWRAIEYTFATRGGDSVTGVAHDRESLSRSLSVGSEISVQYNRDDPREHFLEVSPLKA